MGRVESVNVHYNLLRDVMLCFKIRTHGGLQATRQTLEAKIFPKFDGNVAMLKHLETVQCKYSATQTEHANPHQERSCDAAAVGALFFKDSIEISHTPEYTWPSNNRGLCN